MPSDNNTSGAKISSAPVVEVDPTLDSAAEARDPIFPENEDWDEDDFGGGESNLLADDRIEGVVHEEEFFSAVAVVAEHESVDNSGGMVTTQQPLTSFSEEYFTATESLSNDAGETPMNDTSKGVDSADDNNKNIIDCVDDENNTTAKTASAKISTAKNILEKRRQRRERRQMKPEGQQQQQRPTQQQQEEQSQSSREQPQQQQQNKVSEDTAKAVVSDSATPTSPTRRRQRMAKRVAQGKVSLKVSKLVTAAARKDDDGVAPVSIPNTSSNNEKVELRINDDDEEIQQENGGLTTHHTVLEDAPVNKNEARRQRRVVRNSKGNDKEEKSTLELLVMADEAIGRSNDEADDAPYDHPVVVATEIEKVDKATLLSTSKVDTHSKSLLHAASSDYSIANDDDDDDGYDGEDDPIIDEIIAKALDDARVKREAEKSNANIESNEIFDLGHDSRDVINEDEAKLMFPTQNAMEITSKEEEPVEPPKSIPTEAAWDTEGIETLSKALDEGRARNSRIVKSADGKPLLQLEMAYSDDNDKERLEEAASSSKLMSQKERIAMYTSTEGFGVGDDSSVENDDLEGDTERIADQTDEDDDIEEEAVGYEDLTNVDDDAGDESNDEIIDEGIDRLEVGKIRSYSVPTFSVEAAEAAEQRTQRWNRNPDAVSDIDDESDIDVTRKGDVEKIAVETSEIPVVMIKIPPPPPEKLQEWMESKNLIKSAPTTKAKHLKEVELSPVTPRQSALMEGEIKLSTSPYKITSPKSPTKKKPNTIIEELDLKSHKKMAEKIAFASSKAAKKFEEEYAHGNLQEGQRSGDSPQTQSPVSPERTVLMPTVGELVGGAFSPWKIPERDDDSNISLNRAFSDNASFSNATAAALRAINTEREKNNSPQKEEDKSPEESFEVSILTDETIDEDEEGVLTEVLQWLFNEVLPPTSSIAAAFSAFDLNISTTVQADRIRAISNDDESFNKICEFVTSAVMSQYGHKIDKYEQAKDFSLTGIKPFVIPLSIDARPKAEVLATSFMSFLEQVSNLAEKPLPWREDNNPLLDSVMNNLSSKQLRSKTQRKTMQELIFPDEKCVIMIFQYLREVCGHYSNAKIKQESHSRTLSPESIRGSTIDAPQNVVTGISTVRRSNHRRKRNTNAPAKLKNPLNKESLRRMNNLNLIFPKTSPSPFETAVWNDPSIILSVLSFVGNPVTVCVFKRLNVFCNRVVCENEHVLMRDAVRLGGMSKYVRPSFWLWVTEKSQPEDPIPLIPQRQGFGLRNKPKPMPQYQGREFNILKNLGAAGKWHPIIERDVTRAFGNMPPHKTGARYRQDSIVRALVTFGKEELIRSSRGYQSKTMDRLPERSQARHFKLSSRLDHRQDEYCDSSDGSLTPTDTVSDWGGISPVASYASEDQFAGNVDDSKVKVVSYESMDRSSKSKLSSAKSDISDPVLCGNALTTEMKVDMQKKLRSILHALAARHQGVGYCQGMDYIVAHLLRVLQDTILLRIIKAEDWQTMPNDMLRKRMSEINTNTEIVEEVVFRVMDTFFTTYSLQHMYWPELRCLKTCCRVFEILIRQKLPVLADHFEHHDLNVGLFALGWFQTLFLYLPSMPSATVCHMWDIWLVERSFKIFFRVGTAILFLSQPTLLNHDLEGMMTYLNTFPDATLLRADILIPCALQIKITNKMLVEIEMEATDFYSKHNEEMPPAMG